MDTDRHDRCDVIVVGAGIGGLLAAAHLAKMGKRVVVLERTGRVGGRFASITRDGYQLSTGAVHMVPFGSRGPFARLLRSVVPSYSIRDADALASFHVDGRHLLCHKPLDTLKLFSPREKVEYLAIVFKMGWSSSLRSGEPFGCWLKRQTDSQRVFRLFERAIHFGLSVEAEEVSCQEVRSLFQNVRRMRYPGVLTGGCGRVVQELQAVVERFGGLVLTRTEATQILVNGGEVCGVVTRDRRAGNQVVLKSEIVVSDAGPKQTQALIAGDIPDAWPRTRIERLDAAQGLKVHFSSDESLIPHAGVLYCLDTQRVAGVVQPSNADPGLAPPGKHLLISHQVMRSSDLRKERALAWADLRCLFQDRFEVLSVTAFRDKWPVNRAKQGQDIVTPLPIRGLHMVGDGCKAPGYLMVEGVAKQVERVVEGIGKVEN